NVAVAKLNDSEKPIVLICWGSVSITNGIIAPLYRPKKSEYQSSTSSSREKLGALVSHAIVGYAVRIQRMGIRMRREGRPILSETAPPTGTQTKLEIPTHSVTTKALVSLRCSASRPNVGVYAVIR